AVGQHEIRDDDVREPVLEVLTRLGQARGGTDGEAFALHELGQSLDLAHVIVDEQRLGLHADTSTEPSCGAGSSAPAPAPAARSVPPAYSMTGAQAVVTSAAICGAGVEIRSAVAASPGVPAAASSSTVPGLQPSAISTTTSTSTCRTTSRRAVTWS